MLLFDNYATFSYCMLKSKKHKTSAKTKISIFIVNKASYFVYLELHTCSDKTQLTTALHFRLEAVT